MEDSDSPKKEVVKIDVTSYNKDNRVSIKSSASYNFNSFVDDLDRVTNPTPPNNTEILEL
jgi:hypothetical protein